MNFLIEKEALKILEGNLTITDSKNAKGIVIFAHGSGISRHSPRNQFVAQSLNKDCLATLLVDLITKEEEETWEQINKIRIIKMIITAYICGLTIVE